MIELAFAILGVLGGAFLVWLGWYGMRAVQSERRADSGRWRGERESLRGKAGDGRGQSTSAREGRASGDSVGSVGFWTW